MNFSPEYMATYIVRPLRYLFQNYVDEDIRWDDNIKTTGIEIDTINNFNKIAIQEKPRILVSRGQYRVEPSGLSDSMANANSPWAAKGARASTHQLFIRGMAQVMVQARNEGTAEKIVGLTQHFLSWTGPMLSDVFGFKQAFIPMDISPCVPMGEDGEIFSCTINLPWCKEEHFQVTSEDTIKFKAFALSLIPT